MQVKVSFFSTPFARVAELTGIGDITITITSSLMEANLVVDYK